MAILIAGLAFILIIAYLLLAPIKLSLEYPFDKSAGRSVRVAIFPFKFKWPIISKDSVSRNDRAKPKKAPVRARKKKTSISTGQFLRLLIDEFDLIMQSGRSAISLISSLIKSPRQFQLRISMHGDFASPDISGMIYGWSMALNHLLGDSASIIFRPDFADRPLRVGVSGGFEIRIWSVVKEVLIFIWTLPKLRLLKAFWRVKKGARDVK